MTYLTTFGLSLGELLANTTVSNWLWHAPLYTATALLSLFGELDHAIAKECIDIGDTKPSWGVTYWTAHTIGNKLATINFGGRLRKENYALKKFLLSHKSAKRAISDNHMGYVYFRDEKWADRREKWNCEHRDDVFEALKKMFEFTPYQKGFSITSKHKDKANALEFLDYLLTDKKETPQLSHA